MKRIFTLLVALIAMATTALGETINLVEATSEDLTPQLGTSVWTAPTFTVTTGAPAYFNTKDFNWQKKVDGEWQFVTEGNFTPGIWRYHGVVVIDETTDPEHRYVLTEDATIKVNGVEWEKRYYDFVDSKLSRIGVNSPEFILTPPETITEISLVEATSPNLTTIPKLGAPVVNNHPTFNVTSTTKAYFDVKDGDGRWQKLVDGQWQYVQNGNFTEGVWRYACQVRIDESTDPSHQYSLAKNVTVKVNGQEWERGTVNVYSDRSHVFVTSPEITVKYGECSGTMGERGFWTFANGVLTVDYDGAMPYSSQTEEDPNVAFRLQWIDFLSEIDEVVITGQDVEIQPFFLYYEGDGTQGQHPDDHITKITLGSGVRRIGNQALAVYDLKDMYCYREILPILASYYGANQQCFWKKRIIANNARLHVPPGTEIPAGTEWELFNVVTDLDPEDDPVDIRSIDNGQLTMDNEGSWYTLDGRKLSGKPAKAGLYIVGGKKVLVK